MMTYEQLLDEKQTVQKLLLNFERKYKRPVSRSLLACVLSQASDFFPLQQTKAEKDVMRPIYDRYREIKRQLVNYGSKRKVSNINFMILYSTRLIFSHLTHRV